MVSQKSVFTGLLFFIFFKVVCEVFLKRRLSFFWHISLPCSKDTSSLNTCSYFQVCKSVLQEISIFVRRHTERWFIPWWSKVSFIYLLLFNSFMYVYQSGHLYLSNYKQVKMSTFNSFDNHIWCINHYYICPTITEHIIDITSTPFLNVCFLFLCISTYYKNM